MLTRDVILPYAENTNVQVQYLEFIILFIILNVIL